MTGAALLAVAILAQSLAVPEPDLTLALSCGATPSEVTLRIRNAGSTDVAALIGIAIGNGQRYLPRELVLELRRSGSATMEELVYTVPRNVAGRMDHWVLALPGRAEFTLTLQAADFLSTSSVSASSPPEELRARLTGRSITSDLNVDMAGMKAWRLWTGTVRSSPLRLADCPRESPTP